MSEVVEETSGDWFAENPRLGGLVVFLIGAAMLGFNMYTLRESQSFGMKTIVMGPTCMLFGLSALLIGAHPKWVHCISGAAGLGLGIYLLMGLKGSAELPSLLVTILAG